MSVRDDNHLILLARIEEMNSCIGKQFLWKAMRKVRMESSFQQYCNRNMLFVKLCWVGFVAEDVQAYSHRRLNSSRILRRSKQDSLFNSRHFHSIQRTCKLS